MSGESPSMAVQLASTALALAFVLALAWLVLRALKRLQQRGGGGAADGSAPQVVHSVGLGPRERLLTVRWRGRDYLLGVGASGVNYVDHREVVAEGGVVPIERTANRTTERTNDRPAKRPHERRN